jgi:hypothetical protein
MTQVVAATSAARHGELYRHAVIAQILRRLPDEDASAPWLAEYRALSQVAWGHEIDALEAVTAGHLPLARLERDDALVLMAAGLIEEDIRFGSLFATLQEPLASRRPCFGLLGWLLAAGPTTAGEVMERCQRLAQAGLLMVDNPADPRSEWVARLPVAIWDLLGGGSIAASSLPASLKLRPADSFPPLEEVVVPPELRASLPRISALLASGSVSTLVVRGPESSGRLTLLGSIASQLGRDVLVHEGSVGDEGWRLLGPLAALGGAMAVTVPTPAPGETCRIPAFPSFGKSDLEEAVMLGVVAGRHGGLAGPALEGALSVVLHSGDADDRRRLWLHGGLRVSPASLDEVVERFLLTPGNIRRAAPLAQAVAASRGRREVVPSDVRAATNALSRQVLETLATHLRPLDSVAPPVLAPVAAAELATLLALCRHRERLPGQAGAAVSSTMNRGVRALFSGPSGTGKTLAARYVGAQLGLDVYRIDLAAVMSKYIGETERNLDQVLGRAEELDVVLLLDEGDALMTGRTEVGNANDRYANLETNFLLQRLETFEGIVVITSNASNRIDIAFQRRIDVTVELLPPDADARHLIWVTHLPPDHAVSPQLLEEVARRCALTGGRIRNASLHACLLALEGNRPVEDQDLVSAIQREYRRMGATLPLAQALDR